MIRTGRFQSFVFSYHIYRLPVCSCGAVRIIRAKEFILEDENDNDRAILIAKEVGPEFVMTDANGRRRIWTAS